MIVDLFPHAAVALAYVSIGFVSDRYVAKRVGWQPTSLWHWGVFGAAHWAWPLWLLALAASSRPVRRWVHIAWAGWSDLPEAKP